MFNLPSLVEELSIIDHNGKDVKECFQVVEGSTTYKSVLLLCDCAREKERRVGEARALREKQVRVSRISKCLRFGFWGCFCLYFDRAVD